MGEPKCGFAHTLGKRMRRLAVALAAVAAAGCGGDDKETAPVAWCNNTGQLIYLLDQHSTTMDTEAVQAWEEAAPEDIRAAAAQMGAALRRYPVDAHAADLVAARKELETYAADSCQDGWEGPNPYSG
jgi:hypothetical protein